MKALHHRYPLNDVSPRVKHKQELLHLLRPPVQTLVPACPTLHGGLLRKHGHALVTRASSPKSGGTAVIEVTHTVPTDASSAQQYKDALLLQGFGWDSCQKGHWYKTVQTKIPDIKAAGVTHLWLPPPSQSVSPQGYMPGQLYNLNTKYGTKEELISLIEALKANGIKPVADIVINHRCADEQENGVWNKFRDDVDHKGRKIDWGKWAITSNDPEFGGTGNPDTGDDYGPAPDLDHANPELRAALKDWMKWLQEDVGFQGWRLDFVRGYGARFVTEYVDYTVGPSELNVGEFWVDMKWGSGGELDRDQDAARQRLVDWVNGNQRRCCAFDFPMKGILQEAVRKVQYQRLKDAKGKAPGLLGWWPTKSVTFIDNHDTGSTQNHWPFPSTHVALGYAYIMTHPGIPCVFWDHLVNGDEVSKTIKTLSALRKRCGIVADSKLEILCAEPDMYVARIADKVVVKLGPRYEMGDYLPKESAGWKFLTSGKDFAIWELQPVAERQQTQAAV